MFCYTLAGTLLLGLLSSSTHAEVEFYVAPGGSDAASGTRDFLGARVKNVVGLGEVLAYGLPGEIGVIVVKVPAGSVADRAGLGQGDVILKCGDREVRDMEGLFKLWNRAAKGTRVTLGLWRLQQHASVSISIE